MENHDDDKDNDKENKLGPSCATRKVWSRFLSCVMK